MLIRSASDRSFGRMRVMAMSGWQILAWTGVCVAGAIIFLKVVANELDRSRRSLRDLEEVQRREHRRRVAQENEEEVITLTSAASDTP